MINQAKAKLNPTKLFFSFAFCAFLISATLAVIDDTGIRNLYTHQAEAFLKGRLDIQEQLHDVAIYGDRFYVPFPPFPAVLLLPFEAIFGSVNTTLVSLLLTLISVFVLKDILKMLDAHGPIVSWLLFAFFLGTGYWQAVILSKQVYFLAHVVCVTFMLLSIREAIGMGRGLVAGILLGFAFLSRQLIIYSSIFVIAALWTNQNHSTRISRTRAVLGLVIALSSCVALYLAFNYFRFGSPFDTGYSYLELRGLLASRVERFGLFSPVYVPFNLIYMFFQGPHIEFAGELTPQTMDPFGTSITFASPFLVLAFLAQGNRWIRLGAWLAVGLTLSHMLFYYNNGWIQANNQRFTLDFLPLLIILSAMAAPSIEKYRPIFYWSVAYSVSLNVMALLLFPNLKTLLMYFKEAF